MTFTRWLLQTRVKITCCQRTVSSNIEGICKHISLSLPANRHGSNIWEESNWNMPNIQLRIRFYLFTTQLQNECTEPKLVISWSTFVKLLCFYYWHSQVTNFTTCLKKWSWYNGHKWEFMLSNSKVWHYIMGLVEILGGHTKRDAMKAQRYNNLNYLQTCNMWLGSMLNEPVCIHGDPALPRYDHL